LSDPNILISISGSILAAAGKNQTATPAQGFPKAALDAAKAGDLTKAKPPTANNSIGLDIE